MCRPITLAMALGFALVLSAPALAGGLKPEDAETRRQQVDSGDAAALEQTAEELGDPELFLRASESLRFAADASRDLKLAEQALPLAMRARDIALYLSDEDKYKATDWHPVTQDRARALTDEAKQAIEAIDKLMATIEEEQRRAEDEEQRRAEDSRRTAVFEEEDRRKKLKMGNGLIAGGSVALAVGASGVAMLSIGLARGASLRREAESLDPSLEFVRIRELNHQGAQANTIAYVGGTLGGVGLATGVALVVVGARKRKQAGPNAEARVNVGGYMSDQGGGLQLTGRF